MRLGTIHTEHSNGFLYVTGKTLYSTLSDEIHRYLGKVYKIRDDDGWTKVVTEVLRSLEPTEFKTDTQEVDWEKERKKYVT